MTLRNISHIECPLTSCSFTLTIETVTSFSITHIERQTCDFIQYSQCIFLFLLCQIKGLHSPVLVIYDIFVLILQDSVSGITAGVAAGMPVIGLATRNPEHLLTAAKPAFLIKDFEDPKLWTALEELDKNSGITTTNLA